MSAASLLAAGRKLAETLRPDTGTITRGGGQMVFDPLTGNLTPAGGTVIYTGPCRLRTTSTVERDVLFGESQVTTSRFTVTFPWDVPNILIDDVVTISVSDDPHIGERTYRVVFVPSVSYLTYRMVGVEAVE